VTRETTRSAIAVVERIDSISLLSETKNLVSVTIGFSEFDPHHWVCSSVNLIRFIVRPLFVVGL
jgi:hypothetical protein